MSAKIGETKNHKILKILCFSLIFSVLTATPLLISSCSKKKPPSPNPTEYTGSWDGSDWKGHESGVLTCTPNNDGTVAITDAHGYTAHDLVIPWKVEKVEENGKKEIYSVTEIIGAFEEYDKDKILTGTLTLPDTLISLLPNSSNYGAFNNCTGLTKINFGNSIKIIGDYAFHGCRGMVGTLIIPDSVETIGILAFYWCSGLTGTLIIPDSVENIGEQSFQGCSNLTGLILGKSVKNLRSWCFRDQTILRSITLNGYDTIPTWTIGNFCFTNINPHGIVSTANGSLSPADALAYLKTLDSFPADWTT